MAMENGFPLGLSHRIDVLSYGVGIWPGLYWLENVMLLDGMTYDFFKLGE